MVSHLNSLLASSSGWATHTRIKDNLSPLLLEKLLFNYPCIQIDFPGIGTLDEIKDLLLDVCLRKGECLDYDGAPFLRLPDYSTQIAEWHYDGISSLSKQRIPDWIFFVHSGSDLLTKTKKEKGFTISNCHLLYNHLSECSKCLIADISQLILGHKVGTANLQSVEKADLLIKLVDYFSQGIPLLRAHIPLPSTFVAVPDSSSFYCFPDDLNFCFQGLSWDDQKFLLSDIHAALSMPGVTYQHAFDCDSILAIHNKSCFHSAQSVRGGIFRPVYRLQLIDAC